MIRKFWIVTHVTDLYGSEGEPRNMPSKDEVRVFYTEADAEEWLLEMQSRFPFMDLELVVFEAKKTARRLRSDVFCITELIT